MDLGARLRQARLEKGLSQRQLCGEKLTRNMLSQIENGSAFPSLDTLQYLASRLEMPVGFFLGEETANPNLQLLQSAQALPAEQVLPLLHSWQADPVLDDLRYLLEALSCLTLAEQALNDDRSLLCREYLEQADGAIRRTRYCTAELTHRRLLLCHRAGMSPTLLAAALQSLDEELLLRAEAALEQGQTDRCLALLDSMENRPPSWFLLRGKCLMEAKDHAGAVSALQNATDAAPESAYTLLEQCYLALEDYKNAYYCANRRRKQGKDGAK